LAQAFGSNINCASLITLFLCPLAGSLSIHAVMMMCLVCFVLQISATTAWAPDASRLGQSLLKKLRHRRLQQARDLEFACTAMEKLMACNTKVQLFCAGDCEWKAYENRCDISGGTEITRLIQKGMECHAKTQPTCNGECKWGHNEDMCDINAIVITQLMLGGAENTTMVDVMQKEAMCNAKTQPTCNGDCEWRVDDDMCDLQFIFAMQLMMADANNTAMGGGDNNAYAVLIQKTAMCSAKTQPTCNGDCEWRADENKCDLNEMLAMQLGGAFTMTEMAVECNAKAQQACNKECKWIADENKCDLNPQMAVEIICEDGGDISSATRAFANIAVLAVALRL